MVQMNSDKIIQGTMRKIIFLLFFFILSKGLTGQKLYFVGLPQKILKHGDYRQNIEIGKYYYSRHNWEKAVEHFNQCSALSRRRNHYSYLTRSYLYLNDLPNAKQTLKRIRSREEKQLLRLAIIEISSYGKDPKFNKNNIDRIIMERQYVIDKTKSSIIAMAKNHIPNFGD